MRAPARPVIVTPATRVTAAHLTPLTRNITAWFRYADTALDLTTHGEQWYPDTLRYCIDLAHLTGHSVEQCVGVVAAMSASTEWNDNKNRAKAYLLGKTDSGHTDVILDKCARIMRGDDVLTVLNANKTQSFYRNIMGDTDTVTVDRHAMDLAWNRRHPYALAPKVTSPQYVTIADAYRRAARIVGTTPVAVQATTWLAWRMQFNKHGKYVGLPVAA